MEEFRSKSHGDRRTQIERRAHDLRSYSVSEGATCYQKEMKGNKGLGLLSDPEMQRKKRVAGYKVYSVEGKVKGSFRKSLRWIKSRYADAVYGWW